MELQSVTDRDGVYQRNMDVNLDYPAVGYFGVWSMPDFTLRPILLHQWGQGNKHKAAGTLAQPLDL